MKIDHCYPGQVLANTDKNGTGYYKVIKVNRVTIDVVGENGNKVRAYPHIFEREVPQLPTYETVRRMFEVLDARRS